MTDVLIHAQNMQCTGFHTDSILHCGRNLGEGPNVTAGAGVPAEGTDPVRPEISTAGTR